LLGNNHLFQEREILYKTLVTFLINLHSRPIILVDWSGVTQCGKYHMIRASIPVKGRSLTIYEEVYPESKKDSPKANKIFLSNLKKILPSKCCPIIVTDAGFRNPWFIYVLNMSWDFVGRIRNETHVKEIDKSIWIPCKELYKKATSKAQYLGRYLLAKSNPLLCSMFLMKGKRRYRKKKNLKGHKVRCSSSLKHAKRNKEPWLIATSLATPVAHQIMKIYKLRMSIEQGFRDTKNYRNGLCFRETRSTTVKRLSILLLIGAIATFIIYFYGQACQLKQIQYQFQTNSIRNKKVLSWFFLGNLVIKLKTKIEKYFLEDSIKSIIFSEEHYYV
jgi:DDE family transposase